MNIPTDLKYTKDHEWLRLEGETAFVGITDFAQSELGDIVFVDISTEGEKLNKEEVFGSVEAVKTVSDLYVTMECQILEVNELLDANPELVNDDPYGKGWMVKIKLSDVGMIDNLMSSDQYADFLGN